MTTLFFISKLTDVYCTLGSEDIFNSDTPIFKIRILAQFVNRDLLL